MIPFPQAAHGELADHSWVRSLAIALPRTYALVFYSTDVRLGWMLLGLSMMVPLVGLSGLAGVVLAAGLAWVLRVEHGSIRSGFMLFNSLLACSAVVLAGLVGGWTTGVVVVAWASAAVMSLMLTIGLQGWWAARLGLSVQSMPAVIAVMLVHCCGLGSGGQAFGAEVATWGFGEWAVMPDLLRGFFRAFAAIVFSHSEVVGLLIYVAMVMSSPLGALMATVGYVAGTLTLHLLGLPVGSLGTGWCGFNFLLAGVALGAGYQVPNRSSLVLAAAGAALTAVVAVALATALAWFRLAPGALPYNLVVLGTMAALRLLPRPAGLLASPWTVLQPEAAVRLAQLNALRFPDFYRPALFLPCAGERVVTQGFDGGLTHRGWWRHALDFEAPGGAGSWGADGAGLRDFLIFESPVYSTVTGTVVAVENHVPDNAVGANNPEANWGNYVIVRADAGWHVMHAHFLMGSVVVVVGQRVAAGALLGRCGNSGRSPVPHLHVHVQAGPLPGAPTLPFVLKHFIARPIEEDGAATYHLSGVPDTSMTVRPAVPSAALHACFTGWLPGEYSFQNGHALEQIKLEFDASGRFRLENPATSEWLQLYLAEGVLYADPFEGAGGGVLAMLAVVLARVPCIAEPGVVWHEVVAAAPFWPRTRRVWHDLCDPFLAAAVLHFSYSVKEDGGDFHLSAHLEPADFQKCPGAPKWLRAVISGRHGVCRVDGETCGGREIQIFLRNRK